LNTESIIVAILSIVISSIISVLLSEQILSFAGSLMMKVGIKPKINLNGIWKATFTISKDDGEKSYTEIIRIKSGLGRVYGSIEPDERNYAELKDHMEAKPLRIKGELLDNRYLTGFWYHPIQTNRTQGTFQMILYPDTKEMRGLWMGYSVSGNIIEGGEWVWKKEG
jgi:hypothetical protein